MKFPRKLLNWSVLLMCKRDKIKSSELFCHCLPLQTSSSTACLSTTTSPAVTCLTCRYPSTSNQNNQNLTKVAHNPSNAMGLLALGTDRGCVSVWDLTRGVLACRLGEGQSLKRFTGMAFSADGSRLYTSNAGDGDVLEWGLGTGECRRRLTGDKHGASALVVGPAGSAILAVARTRIHLIDLVSGERRKKI